MTATKVKNVNVLVGTRKGAFVLTSDTGRKKWEQSDPIFLGHIIHHFAADTRTAGVMLMAAKTGHLGPTVFRSTDGGTTWTEASKPPAFAKVEETPDGKKGRVVERVFWLTQGHDSQPGVWYAGTSPAGVFISKDDGDTWEPVAGFNDNPMYEQWTEGATPDGVFLHSILVDPRDSNHMYLGISIGGCFESTDAGASWKPLNKGIEAEWIPDPTVEFGHDPHCIVYHPASPDRLYQQNHCGIYKIDRPSDQWIRIGRNMPEGVGDIGFPIVVHPTNVDTAWVFPMDGTEVWPRTSPEGKPAAYVTTNGGDTWKRQDKGLPHKQAYLTVKRQAMTTDKQNPVGLYFGTTGGEVWASADEGETWECIARHLPEVYSLTVQES
ncbi:hypothetical protein KF728_09185 [Candidatus Obscuribacterales bacterium]|nr:hypothetical protein [Candidatus Obscuribacterales bacterium]